MKIIHTLAAGLSSRKIDDGWLCPRFVQNQKTANNLNIPARNCVPYQTPAVPLFGLILHHFTFVKQGQDFYYL